MQYCMSHPEEMSKLSKLKAQITEVKGIMVDNIEKVHSFNKKSSVSSKEEYSQTENEDRPVDFGG